MIGMPKKPTESKRNQFALLYTHLFHINMDICELSVQREIMLFLYSHTKTRISLLFKHMPHKIYNNANGHSISLFSNYTPSLHICEYVFSLFLIFLLPISHDSLRIEYVSKWVNANERERTDTRQKQAT